MSKVERRALESDVSSPVLQLEGSQCVLPRISVVLQPEHLYVTGVVLPIKCLAYLLTFYFH